MGISILPMLWKKFVVLCKQVVFASAVILSSDCCLHFDINFCMHMLICKPFVLIKVCLHFVLCCFIMFCFLFCRVMVAVIFW